MTTPIVRCAACNGIIDPAFDTAVTDTQGRRWHSTCRAKQASSIWNSIPLLVTLAILLPIAGVVAGIVLLFKERVGPGLGIIVVSVLTGLAYVALLAP